MNKVKQSGAVVGTSLLSAIAASLCCITPVIAMVAGSSSIAANFSWLEPARPYLIGLSIVVLAFAWYRQFKPVKNSPADCNCETGTSPTFLQSKKFLGIVTILSVLLMTFPLYAKVFYPKSNGAAIGVIPVEDKKHVVFSIQGMSCKACEDHVNHELSKVAGVVDYATSYADRNSSVTFISSKVDVKAIAAAIGKTGYKVKSYEFMDSTSTVVSFYEAPLVCHAAPSIGCGSKAKFLLIDLEKNKEAVQGAWLNKEGTVVAVKWAANVGEKQRAVLIKTVSVSHNIELNALPPNKVAIHANSFPDNNNWYKGSEVDKLSKEEAAIIAQNTIAGYKKDGLVKAAFENQFKADIENIYVDLFLSISSYGDLTNEAYNKVEDQIQKAGEKYVGKGKMPKVELCIAGQSCEKDQSCAKDGGSCCEKK